MVVNLKTPNADYFERTETLLRYYEDIKRFKLLSLDEERELFYKFRHGNKDEREMAKQELIKRNQRFVVAMAKRYGTNDNILDLINEGNLGLIEALDSYKDNKGCERFMSWAVWFIRRAINNYCINYGNVVKKNNLSKTYHIISQATNSFLQKEYRQPTLEELADVLRKEYDVNIKNLGDILETKVTSIDESFNSDDDNNNIGDIVLYNNSSSSYNDYECVADNDFNKKLTANLLRKLSEREKKIIMMNFGIGYDREYEVQEIAEKLKLTTERVRQLKNEAIKKVKLNYKQSVDVI